MRMATFGDMLGSLRKREGLSQEELATKAHTSARYIRALLTGERFPSPATCAALSSALGLTGADHDALIAAGAERKDPSAPTTPRPDSPALTQSVASLLLHYRRVKGWSRAAMAERLGANPKYVQQLETGQRSPGRVLLKRYIAALGMSEQDRRVLLMTAEGKAPPSILLDTAAPAIYDPSVPSLVGIGKVVGREQLLAQLTAQVSAREAGPVAVALCGIPGVGKTSVAVTLAHSSELRQAFPAGVLWGNLGPRPDIISQYARWARLLMLPHEIINQERAPEEWKRLLREATRGRRLLIILDDAWSYTDAQALYADNAQCAYVLTTRRFDVAEEFAPGAIHTVRELNMADGISALRSTAHYLGSTSSAEALELEQRLVELVDGLPLSLALLGRYLQKAIERSAKARFRRGLPGQSVGPRAQDGVTQLLRETVHVLTNARELVNLSQIDPLTGRDASLRAAIALSEAPLTSAERQAFHALGMLSPEPNSFSREAALAVSEATMAEFKRLLATGLIERHSDDSVAIGNASDRASASESVRYMLHQSVNSYARAAASSARLVDATRRMTRYFAEYANRVKSDFPALRREHKNILESLNGALREGLRAEFVAMTTACANYFHTHGMRDVIAMYLEPAQAIANEDGDIASVVTLLVYRARDADRQGNGQEANRFLLQAITRANELGDESQALELLITPAVFMSRAGQYQDAHESLTHTLAHFRQTGSHAAQATILRHLSDNAFARGETEAARAFAREGVALARELRDSYLISATLSSLGNITCNLGAYREAANYLLESLTIARQVDIPIRVSYVSANLSEIYINLGVYVEATRYLEAALELADAKSHTPRFAFALVNLGRIACARGEDAEALVRYERARAIIETINRPDRLIELYTHFAVLALEQNDIVRASDFINRGLKIAWGLPTDYPELRAFLIMREGECLARASSQESDVQRRMEALNRARARFEETLAIGLNLRHAELICSARGALGWLALQEGNPTLAEKAFRSALTPDLEHRPLEAMARFGLARALFAQGAPGWKHEANASLSLFQEIGHRRARAVQSWVRQKTRASES
jgi:transcriptional regulator with XRE-family HTH domain/tetratricopeptide (TPR) repeat protein